MIIEPAVDFADITDLLVDDHLLVRVVFYYCHVPESSGSVMMSRDEAFGPFTLEVILLLESHFSIDTRRASFCLIPIGRLNNKHVGTIISCN